MSKRHNIGNAKDRLQSFTLETHAELHKQRKTNPQAENHTGNKQPASHPHNRAHEPPFIFIKARQNKFPEVPGDAGRTDNIHK